MVYRAKYRNILDIAGKEPTDQENMCLAIPGRIISIEDSDPEMRMAVVEFGEIRKEICIQWLDNVEVGDYILAHIGTALSKIDEEDARATLEALREMGDAIDPANS